MKSQKSILSNSTNNITSITVTPGPGKYDTSNPIKYIKVNAPKYTMSGKYYTKSRLFTPGPGQYDNNNTLSNKLSSSQRLFSSGTIPKSRRDTQLENREETPGPGRYYFSKNLNSSKSPLYSFTRTKKNSTLLKKDLTPGPGSYIQKPYFGQGGTAYSINKSLNNSHLQKNSGSLVGPGHYNLDGKYNNKPNNTGIKIGTSSRHDLIQSNSPGPAQYSVLDYLEKEKSKNGFTFSKSKNNISVLSDNSGIGSLNTTTPGPGQYKYDNNIKKGIGYSFSKTMLKKHIESTPGPGQYNNDISKIKPNNPSYIIGKSPNTSFLSSNDNPGPGSYNNYNLKSNSSYIFGKEKRNNYKFDNSPGPGQYKIPCSIRDVNNYSIEGGNFDMRFKYV